MNLIEEILSNMTMEKELYEDLNELSAQKTDLIIDKKIKDLEGMVDVEQKLILSIGKLESDRQELVEQLAHDRGLDSEHITMSSLIDLFDGDIKERLEGLRTEFRRVIDQQRHLNEINSRLIETNLEYINIALSLMTNEGTFGKVYEKKGQVTKGNQNKNLFDSKA